MNDHIFNQLCETYGMAPTKPLRDLVEAAVKHEREACAQLLETLPSIFPWKTEKEKTELEDLANCIRMRSHDEKSKGESSAS